ncbi:MAG: dTMP kinase [Deltaproteobacteria bacterium HGW-Deltaproteobacteria-19]|jgi:dTMP kinase|nr:MAG: dTMP kinase [Deltaproteobacteria bacterium HGW-Deltaproteobacteria-19]
MGPFITFEGIEGSGKSTQIRLASQHLEERGIRPLVTGEPGGTSLGVKIRELLLNRGPVEIGAESELLLFAAARSQHVQALILPALREGRWVLCDRFSDATIAYQGFGRGLDVAFVRNVNTFAGGGLVPRLTILVDLPVETGLGRALDRAARQSGPAEDRFEHEEMAFHRRVRSGYIEMARREPDRFRVVDGDRSIQEIHREVCMHLDALLPIAGDSCPSGTSAATKNPSPS